MALFTTNQVRQLYVANKEHSNFATDPVGTIKVCNDTAKTHLYFEYKGAGGMLRSDLIDPKNIISATVTDADKMVYNLKRVKLTLDAAVNGGAPVAGQDYVLSIKLTNPYGDSDEYEEFKFGAVHAISGMTASTFYKTLVISLVRNFSREVSPTLKFYLETGGTHADQAGTLKEVVATEDFSALSGTYTGIVVEEIAQDWILGTMEQLPVQFNLAPGTVTVEGDELTWGVVKNLTPKFKIENGHKMADLEYFCMGERGDQYKMNGYPNYVNTKYLVNPDTKYNVIDIHYAYIGSNESVQKSEKTLTILVPKVGAKNNASNVLANSIVTKINTATGLNIAKLDVSGE